LCYGKEIERRSSVAAPITCEMLQSRLKTYQDVKYATLNAKSSVEIADAIIDREDEIAVEFNLHSVFCPADGVKSVNEYLSCYKYPAIIVHIPGKKLIKCSECGLGQLRSK
jgi:predicted polyphosphate/ATP-dependent NAD kinase